MKTRGKRPMLHPLGLGIALLAGACLSAASQETKPEPAAGAIWNDSIGNGFQKDTTQVGLSLGAGFGVKAFGGTVPHDLALASANAGWIFTDLVAKDRWYRGNPELLGELFAGGEFSPRDRSFAGGTALLRYNLMPGSRWVPFCDGGIGATYTDIGLPDLSTLFEFNVQLGVGTHYFFRPDTALTLQYRWLHFSNDHLRDPNHGVNTEMLLVGLTRFF